MEEARVSFHAFFGLFAAFDNTEKVRQKANSVLQCFTGEVMLEIMSSAAGNGLKSTVRLAGRGPGFRNVIGIEFVQARTVTRRAHDDANSTFGAHSDLIYRALDGLDARSRHKITDSFGVRGGMVRKGLKTSTSGCQPVHNLCF